ncbi:hypothetical protein BC830DRAFT_650511 [Chytriomyces sp. MP71]|nr:hypothetical protein BC830DRAFT_650511 [Chytriomyces sp. MP71]
MVDDVKDRLSKEYQREIEIMEGAHLIELQNASALEKNLTAEVVKLELAKTKAEHNKEIAQLKAHHFDEMAKLISTADAASQLEHLAQKMEESSRLVDSMHHKLESDHSYSVKERETALQLKERQLVELQRQILKQQQGLEDERLKIKAKSDATDTVLEEFRREREDEQRVMDEDRRNLEEQISVTRTERDLMQRQLQRERVEFVRQKESWALERKKALMASSDEQKDLAMEKAILEAKREAVAEMELESQRSKSVENAQMLAGGKFVPNTAVLTRYKDRQQLDKELHALAIKKSDLHRETAALRAEKLAFASEKQRLAAEMEAFEKGWKTAESSVQKAKDVQHIAVEERQRAENLDAEVRKTLSCIQVEKIQVEQSRKALESERLHLLKTRQRIVEDRIQLANDRANIGPGGEPPTPSYDLTRPPRNCSKRSRSPTHPIPPNFAPLTN